MEDLTMEIYVDNNRREDLEKDQLQGRELFATLSRECNDRIISQIEVDGVELNPDYFQSRLFKADEVQRIDFKTKKTAVIIEETIEEAEDYLPRIEEALSTVAKHFRSAIDQRGDSKFNQCLEGLEWYLDVLNRILSLLEDEELKEEGNSLIEEFNQLLQRALKNYQNKNMQDLADNIEHEILGYLQKFRTFNKKLLT